MKQPPHKKIAILGGRRAVKASAYWASRFFEGYEIELLESESTLGGKIKRIEIDGLLVELGPKILFPEKKFTRELLHVTGLWREVLYSSEIAQKNFIVKNNHLHPVPTNFLSSLTSPLLSLKGKIQLLKDTCSPVHRFDESVLDFGVRRFGEEYTNMVLGSLVSGIHGGDPSHTSIQTTSFSHYQKVTKYRSYLLGSLIDYFKKGKVPAPLYGSFKTGTFELVEGLKSELKNRGVLLKTSVKVQSLRQTQNIESSEIELTTDQGASVYAGVISCLPVPNLMKLIPNLSDEIKNPFSIEYVPLVVVTLGFKPKDLESIKKGFGFLVPFSESNYLLNGFYSSWMFPEQNHGDLILWSVQIGGSRHPNICAWSDEKIKQCIRTELNPFFKGNVQWHFFHCHRIPQALPQFRPKHLQSSADFKSLVNGLFPNLRLAGNGFSGTGIENCIRGGKEAADQLKQQLTSEN